MALMHIKIGQTSLCRCDVSTAAQMAALARNVPVACQPASTIEAVELVAVLRDAGYDARIVSGKCDQRESFHDD